MYSFKAYYDIVEVTSILKHWLNLKVFSPTNRLLMQNIKTRVTRD